MTGSNEVKEMALKLGADICGIASLNRFDRAPQGFHPRDVYRDCKSVIVFAKRLPLEIILAESRIAYTHGIDTMLSSLDLLGLEMCRQLNKRGIHGVFIPADTPYEYWDPERMHGQGILSLRHAGHLAGLGVLGRNTLLSNMELGNTIYLGAVLSDRTLAPDPVMTEDLCPPKCDLCIKSCPRGALDGEKVDQLLCRAHILKTNERGFLLKNCNICRSVCPNSQRYEKGRD